MSWDDLPDEIRDIILSKVDGPTLLSVCQTCKFWRDTLSDTDAWKALYSEELDKAHHDERLRAEARHAPSARQAYVVALRYNLLKPYQEHLTRYAHPTFCAAYNPYLIQQHRSYTIGNIIRALFAMWFRPQFFWALACRDAAGIVPRNSQRMIHHALIGLLLLALIPFATYYALLHSGLYIRPQPPFVTVQRYVSTDIISATFWNAVNSEHFARIYANGCTVSFVSAVALLLAWAVPYGMAAQICVHSGIWDGLVIVVPVVALTLQWFMQLQNMKYVALMLAFAVCVYVVCIITFFGVTAICRGSPDALVPALIITLPVSVALVALSVYQSLWRYLLDFPMVCLCILAFYEAQRHVNETGTVAKKLANESLMKYVRSSLRMSAVAIPLSNAVFVVSLLLT